jgi:outer membrane protein OmpA-like peptidoglycan-associated protein
MRSQPTKFTLDLIDSLKNSTTARIAALAIVALGAAIVGPQGLAVGPSQSHTSTPALPTGAAMEARVIQSSIPISFDIVRPVSKLISEHGSYPERQVGDLRFPDGAINVPWSAMTLNDEATAAYSAAMDSRGASVSTPLRNTDTPQLMTASLNTGPRVTGATLETDSGNGLRSMIVFDRMGTDLTGDSEEVLDRLAASLRGNDERIQLRAFGGDIADRTHVARRLALRRALAVRNYLMTRGIDQERITVRAMGGALDGGPSDRVDVVYPSS